MLFQLNQLLDRSEARDFCERLASARFEDGRATARGSTREVKNNLQVPPEDPVGRELAQRLRERLQTNETFSHVAMPKRMLPLRFCKYEVGMAYGDHLDIPLMPMPGGQPLRTDVSMTVFLTDPNEYEGGALVFESEFGTKTIRGGAGDAVLYPSNTLHRVEAVTRGARVVAITWIESLVREAQKRRVLWELVDNVRRLERTHGPTNETRALRQTHYNLTRMWAET